MIDYVVRHQALIRECINGAAMVLCFNLAVVISSYLYDTWLESEPRNIAQWRSIPGVPTACALFWLFLFESDRCGSVWWIYHASPTRTAGDLGGFALTNFFEVANYFAVGLGFNLVLLLLTWTFAPPGLKRDCSLISAVCAAIIVIFSIAT